MRNQNKLFVCLLVVLFAITFSLPCVWAAEGQKIKLSLAHIYTPKSWNETYAVPALFQLVEKRTKGKYILDVAYFPAGTLLASADIFGGVTKGIADIGWSNPGINPGLFPVMATLSQPGIAPAINAYANSLTWWEFYNKFKPKELDSVKVLQWSSVGPGWIHSKKPIRSAEDIKGLKIRVIGPQVEAMKILGAEPVGLPSAEMYLAASKGVIDAALIPMGAVQTFKLDEVFSYSTCVPPLYNEGKYCVMNWDKWKSLPKDLQAAFEAVAATGESVDLVGRIWSRLDPDMTIEQYLPKKHQLIYLPEAETRKLRELMRPIRNKYVATLNQKGFPGEEMVSAGGEIVEKYNKKKYEPWKVPSK
jgi:TRAP-type C4-dicarboxylate transport system substrate-binding protein